MGDLPAGDSGQTFAVVLYHHPMFRGTRLCSRFWRVFDVEREAASWAETKRSDPRYAWYRIEQRQGPRLLGTTPMIPLKRVTMIPSPATYAAWEAAEASSSSAGVAG